MKLRLKLLPNSIRGRLSLLFSLVFGVTLVVTSYLSFLLFTNSNRGEFDTFLFNHAVDIAINLRLDAPPVSEIILEPAQEKKKRRLFSVNLTYAQLCDEHGAILSRSANLLPDERLPCSADDYRAALSTDATYRTIQRVETKDGAPASKPYRLITYTLVRRGQPPWILQIAAPLNLLELENAEILWFLLMLLPFSLLVSGFLGYWASRRAFSPVMRMTAQTAQIEVKSLKERIEVEESDAELRELGRTFNSLLDRVENTVAAQERFIADASHQLKTPLAIVRGELELLQARPGHSSETTVALRNASQEVSQLISLVENLLLLARMDAGLDRISFLAVRLDEILTEATTRLQYVARRKEIKLTSELFPFADQPEAKIDFEFLGDADLIRCLMENLIENAIKYSGERAHVTVSLTEYRTHYLLEVKDEGKGMSTEEIPVIFERFRRDPKKSISVPGAGLGLAIAKKISDLHGGILSVESIVDQGSTFRLELSKT